MTMKIEITIPEDDIKAGAASQYLQRAMASIGFSREAAFARAARQSEAAFAAEDAGPESAVEPDSATMPGVKLSEMPETASEAPKRERGKPAPGRARRTKEEIAEDEAADAADRVLAGGREIPDEPKAAISTGEERIDPTTVEDATQDAADEAAEAETTKTADLTHDDVRAALKKYLDAYGTAAAMEDGPKVLKMLFGDTAAKVSDVPGDQDSLAKAIAGIDEMLTKNPFKREAQL